MTKVFNVQSCYSNTCMHRAVFRGRLPSPGPFVTMHIAVFRGRLSVMVLLVLRVEHI